jgi:RHS repeat-associated protein
MMRSAAGRLALCVLLLCTGLGCWSVAASQASLAPMSLAAPFAPDVAPTPQQISADEASRTAFAHLDHAAAIDLAKQDFHVERPSWMPPSQEEGARVEKYVGDYAAAEVLPGGQHVVASSTIPLQTDNDAGQPAPVSLTLQESGEGYTPENPIVPVVISKQAQNGIALPQGIRVMPVSSASAEAAAVVGNSVVFANAEPDTDLIEEPLPYGADVSWQLRSEQSPQESSLRFELPAGASLQASTSSPGSAEVIDEGKQLVAVPPARAVDAAGSAVITSYTISGDVLTTHVDLGEDAEFPVLVDPELLGPIFAGSYGVANGSGSWAGWQHRLTGNFELYEEASGLAVLSPHGAGHLAEGELYIYPPGPHGLPGSAGITRVDLSNLVHESHEESEVYAEIGESNGTEPIYTFNGASPGKEGKILAPLKTNANLNTPVAFCAEYAGGYDGGPEQPLCDEKYNQGKYFVMNDIITKEGGTANYNEIRATGATVTYRDTAAPIRDVLNDGGYSGAWLKVAPTTWTITGEDEGLGVQGFRLEIPPKIPPEEPPFFTASINCNVQNGFTGCPTVETSPAINLSALNTKDSGPWVLGPEVVDAAQNIAEPEPSRVSLYLDHQPPIIGAFTGSLGEAAGGVIGSGNYTLNFSASDGSKALAQSGVRKIEVKVDGHVVDTLSSGCPEPHGPPAEGCFALSGSTVVNGQSIGAGGHTVSVVATDWAGNVESKSFGVTVNEAAYEPVGPGAVNLETGDFKLNPTDVSISGGDATLSVSRAYDSANYGAATGPLGPEWALSLPDSPADGEWQSLTKLPDESIAVYTAHGRQLIFTPKEGGGYTSPPGYQTDALTAPSQTEYQITDADGNYTRFAAPESGAPFVPSYVAQATAAGGLNKVKYFFTRTKEVITEPTEVIGPEPSEGACTAKLVQGCRALTFVYATGTSAKGEGPTEWGEYKGRLSKVQFTAWEPAKGAMSEPIAVADYSYDAQGRLRAEWDPRLSTPLKTTYGYDAEGHVTALSLPGQEPWLMHYGTFGSDQNTGRLLSVSRFNAETALWKGEALTNTVLPKLSTSTPAVGTAASVSSGTWSSTAVAYSYRWERCTAQGGGCLPIQGATNETYTPLRVDIGHDLVAQVTATNASGSVVATTTASGEVYGPDKFSFSFGTSGSGAGQMEEPTAVAEQGSGEAAVVWVADAVNHRVDEYKASTGVFLEAFGWGVSNGKEEMQDCTTSCKAGIAGYNPGQLNNPEGIAVSAQGWIVVADSADDRVEEYTNNGQLNRTFGSYGSEPGELNDPHGIAVTNTATVWVADTENCRVEEFTEGRFEKAIGKCGTGHGEFEGTMGVAVSAGDVYVTDVGHGTVQEFTEAGVWVREFGSSGSGPGQFSYPWAITTNTSDSDVYVSSWGDGRVEMFSSEGKYIEQLGHFGSEKEELDGPSGLAINQNTGTLYIADELNNRIDAWAPNELEQEPIQSAPTPGTTSVTTVDYKVPVSGEGAPHALGAKEDAEWAQKDVPVEATAIFPPTEPQSWPAGEYKRASIFYMDAANRTVNTASPTGGISTTEYKGATDNVHRTLSPDDREAALKEGSKSAVTAELLSSETEYNGEGTEVTVKRGPQHTVTLVGGTQMLLRNFTEYLYEQGAPSGGPYDLVTETIEGGQDTFGNLHETRTVHDYYSGQSDLGWKLHEPTSTTTSTGKETLETTTSYQPSTGEVEETRTPKGSSPNQASYIGKFARPSDPGFEPTDVARGTSGAVWVLETGPDRIDKFNEKAEYQSQFATEGTGIGQIKGAQSIAVAPNGDIWVADTANDRVEAFTPAGTPVLVAGFGVSNGESKWEECETSCRAGLTGQGTGELQNPAGIALDAHGHVWVSNTGHGYLDQLNEKGEWLKDVGSSGTGAGKLGLPEDLAVDSNGNVWVADSGDQKIQEFTEAGGTGIEFGTEGTGTGQFKKPWGIAIDAHNDIYVGDTGNERAEAFNEKGEYLSSFTQTNGHKTPVGLSVDAKGELWATNIGKAESEGHVEQWVAPIPAAGNTGAHTTQTIYYSAGANQAYPNCAKHPEWAGLPCEGKPAAQPGATGTPNLPETTYTYNIWNEPLTVTDTAGTTTRTTTIAYDAAGRTLTSSITSSIDKALPTVTDEYSAETGALVKQSTTSEGKTKSISSEYNRLGQMTSYTDAAESTTTYEYEKEKEARLLKVTDPKGNETYGYNSTTGLLASVKDSAAGVFTASYDIEGNLVTEGYPNGMNANYKYNQVDEPISLEYLKTTHCTTGCVWYTDSVSPSIHSQWIEQTSTLSKQSYAYDEIGRLTEAQETPAGKDCTDRLYAYDEDGNRTSLTARESSTEKCATEGGISQSYAYDTGDRLDESGVSYEAFGNITSLPQTDAGGSTLTNTYYVNNALATQEQAGKKISYTLDPAGRTLETTATGEANTTYHYDGPESSPSWTSTSTATTRDITGVTGSLVAIQNNTEEPRLQLANLHGDIIATAGTSETESKMSPANETSEYGVPHTTITGKYSWLGADKSPTELPTGIINMGARTYVPQLGRFEQADPQPGGSANSYAYTEDDPINEADPSGEWTTTTTYNYEAASQEAAAAGISESYVGPGAVLAPPVDLQIQEETNASPPWNAAAAFSEGRDGGWSRFANNEDPDDKSPDVESECNKKGQDCPGTRGGGPPSPNTGKQNIEEVCVFTWWLPPVGLVCGVAGAAKYIVDHTK